MSMVNSDCNKNRRDSVSVRFVWLWRLVQLTYLLFFYNTSHSLRHFYANEIQIDKQDSQG